jgi:hypothetical protein
MALAGFCLGGCQSDSTGPAGTGEAHLAQLLHNPKWYRTFDSSTSFLPDGGGFVYSWTFLDPARHPDSFYVGIDTLWSLPRNVGRAGNNWDLQVCPNGSCAGGLEGGIFGVNTRWHFGGKGEYAQPDFAAEHHFQFYPALDSVTFLPMKTDSGIFGGMLFVRSRSGSSPTDTVFAFGTWRMEWDTAYLPPVRPNGSRLPRRADFKIVNGKVRYQPDMPD